MRAIVERDGALEWTEVERPDLGPGEVRIAVDATAVNRADLVQRSGRYPPPPGASPILGLECSGRIVEVGAGVDGARVGQEVVALLSGGGYAEEVVCPVGQVAPRPTGIDAVESAAVVEVFATAWLNLRVEGGLTAGERVLVHAAASGVGTAALQLCRVWGNPTFGTVGSADKEARCRAFGAERSANRHDGPWLDAVREWGGADVILDPVGGAYFADNLAALNTRGRLVNIGLMGGREASVPLGRMLVKRLTVKGSVLRARSVDEKTLVMRGLEREVWPLFADGRVVPVIDSVFDIRDAGAAHEKLAANQTVGKLVLRVR